MLHNRDLKLSPNSPNPTPCPKPPPQPRPKVMVADPYQYLQEVDEDFLDGVVLRVRHVVDPLLRLDDPRLPFPA